MISVAVTTLLSMPVMAQEEGSESWTVDAPQGVFDTVDISVNSGTWMNVDLSPDGKTIVFDLLGDIYRMPASGGAATRLTSDIA